MRYFLAKIMAEITRHPRYFPDIEWSSESWVFNIFRAYEWLFGRRHGVRLEAQTISELVNGRRVITRRFYTTEAFLVHTEYAVREWLKGFGDGFEWVEVPQFQFVNIGNPYGQVIKVPAFVFAIAYDTIGSGGTSSPATSITYSHTATGSDRGIVVNTIMGDINGGAGNVTSMTYAGSAGNETQNLAATGGRRIWMHDKTAISSGANNVVVSFGNSLYADANSLTYSGVDQTDMEDISTKTSAATTVTATVTTTADNCWLSGSGSILGSAPATASTGVTSRGTFGVMRIGDSNGAKTPAGSHSMTWTGTGTIHAFMIAIKPTAAASVTVSGTVQTATFSIPSYTVVPQTKVFPDAQVANFSVPAYTVYAGSVAISATVVSAEFTVPTYGVKIDTIVTPDGQVLTFETPAETIGLGITITPETLILSFVTPTLTKVGAVWVKRGRSTNATWTRSSRNSS